MRTGLCFLTSAAILLCHVGVAQKQHSDIKHDNVKQVIIDAFRGIAESDTTLIKLNWAPDVLILEDGLLWNLDSLLSKVSAMKPRDFRRTNHMDFILTEVTGELAYIVYKNRADILANGLSYKVTWLESACLIRTNDIWKIKLLHSTLLERVTE